MKSPRDKASERAMVYATQMAKSFKTSDLIVYRIYRDGVLAGVKLEQQRARNARRRKK